ncbi:hypothetical protein ACL7TT_16030 [Microbulbifer sp. 2304DJ12-6]|uniref:hypothetical protein n=1 Tax=Microbulbifer sp. 2304DJ12-6 TaxID=3233340 RepID=UPI0039AF7115
MGIAPAAKDNEKKRCRPLLSQILVYTGCCKGKVRRRESVSLWGIAGAVSLKIVHLCEGFDVSFRCIPHQVVARKDGWYAGAGSGNRDSLEADIEK